MKKFYQLILLLLYSFCTNCQNIENKNFKIISNLPGLLKEISGITTLPTSPDILAINDSGNANSVYYLDCNGNITKEIHIPGTKNIDWEDIAYDKSGNVFIGDFGNNANQRKDLCIYKISGIHTQAIHLSKTNFVFEDQQEFPPKKKKRNFDVEGFIYRKNYFYLFTKNRSSDFDGTTKLYKVPAKPGNHVAELITGYQTCMDPKDCFITAACINSTGNIIALLTFNKVFLLSDFKGDNVFNGTVRKIKLGHYSQKEGICFKNDSTLYIVDERKKIHGGNLYELDIR